MALTANDSVVVEVYLFAIPGSLHKLSKLAKLHTSTVAARFVYRPSSVASLQQISSI